MKHNFKFLTLSRVFNDCRDTVGRLSTLFLLLFALLGFTTNAWADSGFFSDGQWKAGFNNGSDFWKGYNNNGATEDLGIQTSLKLIGCNVQTWGDVKTNLDWWISFDSEPTTKNDGSNNFWSIYVDYNGNHENYLDNNDYDMIANATHNPGNNTFYMKWTLRNYSTSTGAAKINFTIPGFSKTAVDAKDFSTAVGGEGQSKTISFTQHYGNALNTGNCKLTGSDISDFSVTGISETGVTVKFLPSTTGTKNATLTITDAHGKKCSITLMGEAQDPLSTGVTLRGTFNSWSTTANEFRRAAAGATTATTTITFANAKQSERFLVYVDGEKYGNSGTILSSTNSAWGFDQGGADCYFNTAGAGTYTFTWDITNKKLSVTYPEETHPSSNYVYFLDDNSWGKASAHLYDTNDDDKITNWPGQPLRTVTIDGKTYYLCAPGAKQKVIFTDNESSSTKRVPSSDAFAAQNGFAKYMNAKTTGTTWKDFEFTLTLEKNGGEADGSARVKWMATAAVSSKLDNTPIKTGYKISKFTEDQAGTKQVLTAGGSSLTASTAYTDENKKWIYPQSVTLYTQWTAQDYVVTLDYNNGSGTTATKNVTYDGNKNLTQVTSNPLPTKTGQDFTGYWTNNDGTGTQLVGSNGYFLDEVSGYIKATKLWGYADNLTIYAGWANHVYNISYKDQGDKAFSGDWGTTIHPTTHTYNTATPLVPAPNKTGYTFGGWFTSSNCEGDAITELGATAYTANITLYAKWNPTTTTITLDRNDGTDATTTHVATYDGAVTSITNLTDAVRTRTGYSHDGIYAAATGGSYIIKYNNGWTYNSTTSEYATSTQWKYTGTTLGLYSQWTAKKYAITLSDNGGTGGSGTTQVTFDAKPASVNVPTKVVSEIAQIFTGYYYNDVQIFNNSGAIVLNAGGGTYTDNSGNWKYDGELELTAKWEAPAKQVVHFGVTNGTTADETSGTISAKIKDTETVVTSGSELDAGTIITISFSAKKGQYISNNGWKIASWWDGANTSTANKLADAAGNSTSYDYTIPTKESSVYAYAPEVTNTFAIVVADGQSARGEVSPAQGTAGPNVKQQITATPNDGYDFVNWTQTSDKFVFVSPSTAESATAEVALKNEQNQTITANFAIHNYTITYNGLEDGDVNENPTSYTIETATITLSDASRDNYTFDGWYDAETEGNKVTEIALGSTGDKTLWARWYETLHSVNITPSDGIESVSPAGATNVGNVTPVTITATVKAGYTWKNWTTDNSSHVTITDANANPTTIKATGSTNVYANATEIKSTLTASVNSIGLAAGYSVSGANAIGVATTATLTTSTAGTGYTFTGWTLTNCTRTDGAAENATTITVKGSGDGQEASAVANYAEDLTTNWRINLGYDEIPGGWIGTQFTKHTGESTGNVAYVEATLEANHEYRFKVVKTGESDIWYGNNNNEDAPKYWINGDVSDWTFKTDKGNCYMRTKEAGTYTFKIDFSEENPKVSVTYPAAVTYTITMANDGNGTTSPAESIELNEFSGTQISATPATGYHFDHWEGTTGIAFASTTSASTTATANQTGTITAHFAANTPIYFQNTMQDAWGTDSMFVYFYKDADYWNGDKGTGSQISNASFIAGPCKMTRISRTNIWEYAYDPTSVTGIVGVVFADRRMKDYEYFTKCNATRRMDFGSGCANMFVLQPGQTPEDRNTSEGNTVHYYGAGFWRNYNSLTSKMYLHIWDCDGNKEIGNYELLTDVVGNESFSATVNLSTNKRYNVYVRNCTGSNFSQKVEITSENCSGFDLYEYGSIDDKSQLAYLTTKSSGDYVFTLTFDDAHMLFSVEYPITSNDYRVKIGSPVRYSNIIRASEASGTISMYLAQGSNAFKYEYASDVDHTPITWTEDETINVNVEKAGVYTMTLHKNKTIDNVKPYTGKYYIRTDCAQGGWNEYKTNDNNLMRFTDRNPKFVNDSTTGFNYYYCRWNANENGNVRFVVANEINACISDTMKADEWLDNNEALKGMANIRFGWNSNTNALSRAYISGSYDSEEYIRILSGDSKLYEYAQNPDDTVITAKKFVDENDWTYTMNVYADGGAGVAVSASYNDKYQSFVGEVNSTTGEISKTEQLLEGGTKQHLHLVYDFKTDRLVSGWVPGGNITSDVILNADMLLARIGQGNADQINIETAGVGIKKIKTIYAVLQLDRDTMLNETTGINAKGYLYKNAIYWFSLPFDVKVNDIFGVDGYGTKWVLQYYDGAKRAKIGFFAETETFWTYLGINDTIKANVGYAVCLDPDYFDSAEDEIWANNRQSVCFYFPSTDKNLKIVGKDSITISVPEHTCTIDRWFGEPDEKHPQGTKNHKFTDTDWNVIGSPAFQNMTGTTEMKINSLYKWNPTDNTYEVKPVEGFTFQSTSAYLVQFHGDIKWEAASVITSTAAAPRYTYADEKNYTIELQFHYGSQWDRTYVALKDNANEDFVLNEDLTKMINSGQPNIYSFAGAYDVAYNGTAFKDQIVNLGVIARKNGSYTFAMPKDFSGSAILVDLESGEATDLNVSNYTVELNKGTYNNRFQLLLEVEAKVPTSIQADRLNGGEAEGKTLKLLRNGNIYLINGGRVYNATGTEVR